MGMFDDWGSRGEVWRSSNKIRALSVLAGRDDLGFRNMPGPAKTRTFIISRKTATCRMSTSAFARGGRVGTVYG